MELTQLRYFLEVAKTQHVTKSAETLHVAQPALTQAIHRLENELEVPLFSSKGRNIVLTPYGKYFYEKLEPLLKSLNELPENLKEMAKTENATIHLNVLAASSLVTEAIIEYQKIDDALHIQIHQNEKNDMDDIRVTTEISARTHENKTSDDSNFICTEKIFLAVPNIQEFQEKKEITFEEIKSIGQKWGFVSLLGSKHLRSICDKYCADAGIKPNIIFESDNPASVKNMIAANIGIGFWPEFSWGALDTSRVRLLKITKPDCKRDILITCKKNKAENSHVENFYKFLTGYFKMASIGEN